MSVESGRIEIIMGCMFSGKSTEIIRIIKRYNILNKKILVINHVNDKRYTDEEKIVTHDMVSYNCIFKSSLEELITNKSDQYLNSEIIVIEEAQFFPDLYTFVIKSADMYNKTIIIAGLDGDFKREKFGDILRLIPHAESVTKLNALCLVCNDGTLASFTKRLTNDKNQTLIGSSESYIAVCRKHFNNL
jgi:thymidine kinase